MNILNNNKIKYIISSVALLLLTFSYNLSVFAVNALLTVCLIIWGYDKIGIKSKIYTKFLVCLVVLFLMIRFFNLTNNSQLLISILGEKLTIGLVVILTSVLGISSIKTVETIIEKLKSHKNIEKRNIFKKETSLNIFEVSVCILSSVVVLLFCTKSSPLYPLNDWVDAQCFFTVGKSMFNGIVPYRDLIEQKGPLLYLLHGLAWLISNNSFFGVYLLECLSGFVFLYFSYKIVLLFTSKRPIYLVPIISLIVFSTEVFKHGDSAEELSFGFLTYAIYLALRYAKYDTDLTNKENLMIGITSGCVFWIKFSLVGLYLGWYIVFLIYYMSKKEYKKILYQTIYIGLGVIISTIPWMIYFGIKNSIYQWIDIYILKNIFSYTRVDDKTGLLYNLDKGFRKTTTNYYVAVILIIFQITYSFYCRNRMVFIHILMMILFCFLFTYMGGQFHKYYSLIFSIFVPCGVACIYDLIDENDLIGNIFDNLIDRKIYLSTAVILIMTSLGSYCLTNNRYFINVEKDSLPQYKFAKIINQEENPTLLNYGFLDGGFYTAANILPTCKSFCKLNIQVEEFLKYQEDFIKNKECMFIVTQSIKENDIQNFDGYELIAEESYFFEDEINYYCLYKRI